jgi:hypothetical protein
MTKNSTSGNTDLEMAARKQLLTAVAALLLRKETCHGGGGGGGSGANDLSTEGVFTASQKTFQDACDSCIRPSQMSL